MTNITVSFVKSAAGGDDFIRDGLDKIIITGRSNVGKSSFINAMAGVNGLARVSSTPGKTAFVNYFSVGGRLYWVDLPGYGYAKVSLSERKRWARLMEDFFAGLDGTARGLMLVDIRHKPTEGDLDMARCFRDLGVPFTVAANKSDKLKKSQTEPALALIRDTLELDDLPLPFSARTGDGKDRLTDIMGLRKGRI
ncbi:MAG: ribosome biogenesis GTP-binding protein YihA/YsxC [Oscillospiraceae bacterium]|nr:ribosome biogenesis GTP-binding protein YihA/YsxC [Oscillospiraceae bacterium]